MERKGDRPGGFTPPASVARSVKVGLDVPSVNAVWLGVVMRVVSAKADSYAPLSQSASPLSGRGKPR
jgi:hypothetical protein